MKNRRLIGLLILVAGIIIIIYAGYQRHRIAEARGENDQTTSMFHGNAASETAGGMYHGIVEGEISKYDRPVMLLMLGGIVVAIVGGALFILGNKNKRR